MDELTQLSLILSKFKTLHWVSFQCRVFVYAIGKINTWGTKTHCISKSLPGREFVLCSTLFWIEVDAVSQS